MTRQHLPRRILMTADTVGGVWAYALELAAALASQGVEVALATMGSPLTRTQWSETEDIPGLRIFESDFKLEWMDDPWEDVRLAGRWLLKLEQSLAPDLVHLNGFAHGNLDWSVPTVVVAHSCVLSWWRAVRGGTPPPSWDEYRVRVRTGLMAADLVVAPSAAMMKSLEACYGSLGNKKVVPNGRSLAKFKPADKQEYVFSAGRLWDEAKNIRALDQISGEVLWPVFVAGERGDYAGSDFSSLNILGRLGQEEIASWFSHASIYALPARYEPFGLSVLEAGLSGCALILGDIPSLKENWDRAALFVPPNDPGALRDAVNELIIDADLRRKLAIKARTRALSFRPERMGSMYLAAYSQLLVSTSSRAAL